MLWTILLPIIAYLIGSIPFGLLLGKVVKGVDIRDVGSGNIGTANAARALGPFWGGVTLVGDALKATIPVLIAINVLKWAPGVFSRLLYRLVRTSYRNMCRNGA